MFAIKARKKQLGVRWPRACKLYSVEEDQIVLRSRTAADALRRLEGRSLGGIFARATKLGKRFERSVWSPREEPSAPFRPYSNHLWTEANAAVPRGLPEHLRDDLISDIIVMFLEGFSGTPSEAFKAARAAHNRMTGAFVERSAFDTLGDTGRRLIDTFTEGSSL